MCVRVDEMETVKILWNPPSCVEDIIKNKLAAWTLYVLYVMYYAYEYKCEGKST